MANDVFFAVCEPQPQFASWRGNSRNSLSMQKLRKPDLFLYVFAPPMSFPLSLDPQVKSNLSFFESDAAWAAVRVSIVRSLICFPCSLPFVGKMFFNQLFPLVLCNPEITQLFQVCFSFFYPRRWLIRLWYVCNPFHNKGCPLTFLTPRCVYRNSCSTFAKLWRDFFALLPDKSGLSVDFNACSGYAIKLSKKRLICR